MAFMLLLMSAFSSAFSLVMAKPNIILMNMDDLGWGDLGCFGEPNRETPNLDRMAQEGMILTNFYSAAAICSPSRAAMLTGRLPIRNGFYSNNSFGRNAYTPQEIVGGIPDSEVLLPEVLKIGGYHTKLIGKWHLGHRPQFHPLKHGFDEWFGAPNCHFKYSADGSKGPNIPVYQNEDMIGRYYEGIVIDSAKGLSNYTQLLRMEALKTIHKAKQPFFLYWAPDSTHGPTYSSAAFRNSSGRGTAFGDAIRELDSAIGDILKMVTESGIAHNTIVIFTSDNGAALVSKEQAGSNGPLLCGKQTTFEGGFRVPTIAWWPSVIPSGSVLRKPATQMDLFTTLIKLANQDIPKDRVIDGNDLRVDLGILSQNEIEESPNEERSVFYYRGDLLMAVRHDSYKMHLWTWTTPQNELEKGIDHCPGVLIANVTTTQQVDHREHPILFNIERDPGEKYPVKPWTPEYNQQIPLLREILANHEANLIRGEPMLNWCDSAVMNWAPPGCEALKNCLDAPASAPYLCPWPH